MLLDLDQDSGTDILLGISEFLSGFADVLIEVLEDFLGLRKL